jgi:hypothetical protein
MALTSLTAAFGMTHHAGMCQLSTRLNRCPAAAARKETGITPGGATSDQTTHVFLVALIR